MVAHAFIPSIWEAEAGGFLSSRPAWSTEWVPRQPGLHRETLSRKTKNQPNKQKNCIQSFTLLMFMGMNKWNPVRGLGHYSILLSFLYFAKQRFYRASICTCTKGSHLFQPNLLFIQNSHTMEPSVTGNSVCRSGWPWIPRSPASAFQVLGWRVCHTMSGLKFSLPMSRARCFTCLI